MRLFCLTLLMASLWLAISGKTSAMILGLGAASVALVVWLSSRMQIVDREGMPLRFFPRLGSYVVWLFREIVVANVAMARVLLARDLKINAQLIEIRGGVHSDVARAYLANSITMTPGTVTVGVTESSLRVHALTDDAADDLRGGSMASRIARLDESPRWPMGESTSDGGRSR